TAAAATAAGVATTATPGATGAVAAAGPGIASPRPIGTTMRARGAAAVVLALAATAPGRAPHPRRAHPAEHRGGGAGGAPRGLRPRVLDTRKGEPLRLTVRTADDEHCFALDAFRVEKRLRPGKPVSVEITPDRAGTFPFHCCLESGSAAETERGELVVAE